MAKSRGWRESLIRSSGRAVDIPFSKAEYRARLKKIRTQMARCGVDLLFLTSPESMFYVCAYRAEWYQAQSPVAWPPLSGVAIQNESERLMLLDYEDEELMDRRETVAPDIRIYPEDRGLTFVEWMVAELKREEWIPSTVGLELRSYRPNRVVSESLQRALEGQGCRVVDGSDIVRGLRLLKSPKELEYVERAATIADEGMAAAAETMRPGMTELQVYGEVVRAMAAAGGENPGITVPVIAGRRSAMSHALASRNRIRRGDIVNIDICGVFNRYHSDMARTFSMGRPELQVEKVVNLSARSFDLVKRVIRPNLGVADFLCRLRSYYEEAGIFSDKMWLGGYELGIAFPPDWVGSFMYDYSTDCADMSFAPGTVVNYESNFFLPRRAGASLLINTLEFGRTKARILGSTPNDLIVLDR